MERYDSDEFAARVYDIVKQIPFGKVASYGQIALLAGYPRRARLVGRVMRGCPDGLPWHRVIRSDGAVAEGISRNLCKQLLLAEGVFFLPNGKVDMGQFRWERQW